MNIRGAGRLAAAHIRSLAAERLYLAGVADLTRPSLVRATINERCNYRCPMCMHWRPSWPRADELTYEEWRAALGSLRAFLGRFAIAFVGGEPFLRRDFLDLLAYCRDRGIDHGCITNGSMLRGEAVRRLVDARPMKLDLSVDGPSPGVHDRSRGVPGSFRAVERAIAEVRDEQRRRGVRFPIRIKPTVHGWNFPAMPAMAAWARRVGASSVDFEPMRPWSPESEAEMGVGPDRIEELRAVVAELIRQKRAGLPIETSEHRLRGLPDHFAGLPVPPEVGTCRVGLRDYHIRPNGDVEVCWQFEPIGNVRRQDARAIWTGAVARVRRRETTACGRGCAYSCQASKPLGNLIERGRLMLSASRAGRRDDEATP